MESGQAQQKMNSNAWENILGICCWHGSTIPLVILKGKQAVTDYKALKKNGDQVDKILFFCRFLLEK